MVVVVVVQKFKLSKKTDVILNNANPKIVGWKRKEAQWLRIKVWLNKIILYYELLLFILHGWDPCVRTRAKGSTLFMIHHLA